MVSCFLLFFVFVFQASPVYTCAFTALSHFLFFPGADAGFTVIDSFSFVVQAKTKNGENKTEGGDNLAVKVSGPSGQDVQSTITDTKDGKYTVSYRVPSAGKYKINITIDGKDIKSSPFTQDVK
jgi:hypothetical protein